METALRLKIFFELARLFEKCGTNMNKCRFRESYLRAHDFWFTIHLAIDETVVKIVTNGHYFTCH